LYKISELELAGAKLLHTTYTLFPAAAKAVSSASAAVFSVRFTVLPKLAPPSVLLLYKIAVPPGGNGIDSTHKTYTLYSIAATAGRLKIPPLLTIIDGSKEIVFLLNRIREPDSKDSTHTV
jgi:hypothetical protein